MSSAGALLPRPDQRSMRGIVRATARGQSCDVHFLRAGGGLLLNQHPQAAPGRGAPYDKLAVRYEATVLIAAINEWL